MADDDLDLQDDALEDEELEVADDGETETAADGDDNDAVTADDLAAAASAHSSLAARNKMREAMQSEIEAFLAQGGKIQQIDDNVMSDPPKKPVSNYGSRPI